VEAPSAEVEVAPPTPPLPHPRSERPLPPLPREAYQFVDPSTLTKSTSVSPASGHRRSSLPHSPSWLSRNAHELEVAVAKRLEASSVSSSRSAWGSDTEEVSTVHLPKAVQTQTPSSPSTTSSSTRLRGEVVRLRGRVNIQDSTPRRITLRSLTPSNKTPSEATVVLRTRSRSRRNRSGYPSQPRLVISTGPPNPPVRPRSRTSSVTKARRRYIPVPGSQDACLSLPPSLTSHCYPRRPTHPLPTRVGSVSRSRHYTHNARLLLLSNYATLRSHLPSHLTLPSLRLSKHLHHLPRTTLPISGWYCLTFTQRYLISLSPPPRPLARVLAHRTSESCVPNRPSNRPTPLLKNSSPLIFTATNRIGAADLNQRRLYP
jgi:hypothetical protein